MHYNADCIMSFREHGWQRVAVHITCICLTQIYMLRPVAKNSHDHACDVDSESDVSCLSPPDEDYLLNGVYNLCKQMTE